MIRVQILTLALPEMVAFDFFRMLKSLWWEYSMESSGMSEFHADVMKSWASGRTYRFLALAMSAKKMGK